RFSWQAISSLLVQFQQLIQFGDEFLSIRPADAGYWYVVSSVQVITDSKTFRQAAHDGYPLRLRNLVAPHPKTAHPHRVLDLILITLRLSARRTHLKTAAANIDHLQFDAAAEVFQIEWRRAGFAFGDLPLLVHASGDEFIGAQCGEGNSRRANLRKPPGALRGRCC